MMAMRLLPVLSCLGFLGATAVAPSAQRYAPGDLAVATFGFSPVHVFRVTPGTNRFTTLASPLGWMDDIALGPDNTDLFVADIFQTNTRVIRITPFGVMSTVLVYYNPAGGGLEPDEDGRLLHVGAVGLASIDVTTGASTIIARGIGSAAVALDRDTGTYVVGSSRYASRVQRDGTVTTVLPLPARTLLFHPGTGDLLAADDRTVLRLDRQNRITTFVAQVGPVNPLALSMAVLANGHVAVSSAGGGGIAEYDASGRLVGSLYSGLRIVKVGMVVTDTQRVWGLNAARIGGTFQLSIRFGAHPGKPYRAAAALAPRPGIPVAGNRTIPLRPDALFVAVPALPAVFRGFQGVLDANGAARATVSIPAAVGLRGVRVFYAAVVLDPGAPGGIAAVSQTFGATIR